MPAPSPLPGVIGGPPRTPASRPVLVAQGGSGGATGGFTVRALTEGVYIAFASNALTDEPLWVNVSERGTWGN